MQYIANSVSVSFYGGYALIDTGYNDPVGWNATYPITELYQARVYASLATWSPAGSASQYMGSWLINSEPCWGSDFYNPPADGIFNSQRVFIKVDATILNPPNRGAGSKYEVKQLRWALYRS